MITHAVDDLPKQLGVDAAIYHLEHSRKQFYQLVAAEHNNRKRLKELTDPRLQGRREDESEDISEEAIHVRRMIARSSSDMLSRGLENHTEVLLRATQAYLTADKPTNRQILGDLVIECHSQIVKLVQSERSLDVIE